MGGLWILNGWVMDKRTGRGEMTDGGLWRGGETDGWLKVQGGGVAQGGPG